MKISKHYFPSLHLCATRKILEKFVFMQNLPETSQRWHLCHGKTCLRLNSEFRVPSLHDWNSFLLSLQLTWFYNFLVTIYSDPMVLQGFKACLPGQIGSNTTFTTYICWVIVLPEGCLGKLNTEIRTNLACHSLWIYKTG